MNLNFDIKNEKYLIENGMKYLNFSAKIYNLSRNGKTIKSAKF